MPAQGANRLVISIGSIHREQSTAVFHPDAMRSSACPS
jgi:hypothetical protein